MEILKLLGLREVADKPIGKLTGGQQQRAMLARALARKPRIMFLDEPFSSLDVEGREFLSEYLLKNKQKNLK